MQDKDRHIAVRIISAPPQAFKRGGLVSAAKKVRGAGRYGDDMIIHINKEEFEELRANWGEPTINPETGMPEFFIKKLIKKIAGPVAGLAANYFLPGMGSAIAGATGLSSAAGQALGSAVIGGGVGALANGKSGALTGALVGGASPFVFGTGSTPGMLTGGLGSLLGGASGVAPAAAASAAPVASAAAPAVAGATAAAPAAGGLFSKQSLPYLSALATMLSSGQKDKASARAAAYNAEQEARFNAPLPVMVNPRTQVAYVDRDYTQAGNTDYFTNNALPVVALADGGLTPSVGAGGGSSHEGHVAGAGSGRSDSISARLSDGEFVIDAETVALLGDGSTKAGAAKLDQLRAAVRKHKGGALAKGKISPDAKHPLQYMKGMK